MKIKNDNNYYDIYFVFWIRTAVSSILVTNKSSTDRNNYLILLILNFTVCTNFNYNHIYDIKLY